MARNELKANAENISYTHIAQFVNQSRALDCDRLGCNERR